MDVDLDIIMCTFSIWATCSKGCTLSVPIVMGVGIVGGLAGMRSLREIVAWNCSGDRWTWKLDWKMICRKMQPTIKMWTPRSSGHKLEWECGRKDPEIQAQG